MVVSREWGVNKGAWVAREETRVGVVWRPLVNRPRDTNPGPENKTGDTRMRASWERPCDRDCIVQKLFSPCGRGYFFEGWGGGGVCLSERLLLRNKSETSLARVSDFFLRK